MKPVQQLTNHWGEPTWMVANDFADAEFLRRVADACTKAADWLEEQR